MPSVPAPLCAMPNAGYPTVVHGRNVYLSSPDYLRSYAAAFAEAGASIIGGCCGTTPEHIRAMARALSEHARPPARPLVALSTEPPRQDRLAPAPIETSRLKRKFRAR